MGQIKKLDVTGFESRVDSHSLNMAHFDTFLKADKALVEADAILTECGIEGITPVGYESRAEKIGKLGEDASLLLKYPDELIDGLQAVDTAFAKGVKKATEALATISIDDIRIKNTFDKEIIGQSESQETSESTLKEYLTMEDVVRSFDELSPQETSFVKEFTDLLYAPYATKNIALDAMVTEKEDEIQELLNGSDHDADKYHPAKEFLREILGVLTSGNYSLSIASMGYDSITKDVLSEEGRKALALSRTPQALKFAFTFGADTKLDELIAYISKPQGGMASLSSSNAYEAMAVSRLETYLLTATSGVAVGYSLAKDGMSFLDFYQKHRQKILQNMAKGTSSRAPAYSTSISANQQNIADLKIDEDALKGAKVLEYKLSLITKEDGSLKYTEKEIQEMIDYVLRKYPISLSSLYHIPSQYYPNQMEICLQHAFEAKQMIPIEKGADLFEDYLRNLKNEDGTLMYTEEEMESMVTYVLEHHPNSLSNLYYTPSQYYRYAVENCLKHINETVASEGINTSTMIIPKPGSSISVSYGVNSIEVNLEVAPTNSWSIEYSIKGCNDSFPNSLCSRRLNYAVDNYTCNRDDYDLLKFEIDQYDQPIFAGAMVEGFARIGDIVQVTLDDDTSFYFLILDTKCISHTSEQLSDNQVQCEYGHGYVINDRVQLNICEFIMAKRNEKDYSALYTSSGGFLKGRYVTEAKVIDHVYIEGE